MNTKSNTKLPAIELRRNAVELLLTYGVTIGLSILALLLFAVDSASGLPPQGLSLSENVFGQLPQLFLCHFRHWSAEHLFWDLGMFAVLAAVCERISRTGMLVTLAGGICLIPPLVGFCDSAIMTYRGLSGLDTALFGMAVVYLALTKFQNGDRGEAWVYFGLLVGMVLKTIHEVTCGTVFVASTNFVPVPVAHIVGAMVGFCVGGCCFLRSLPPKTVAKLA